MSRTTRSRFVTWFLPLFIFMTSAPVFADVDSKNDKVTTDLKKGDKAPYEGILLTYRLAAEVKENCNPGVIEKKCQIKVDEQVGLCKSECKKETDILNAKYDALQVKHDTAMKAKDDYIKTLESQLPKWYESPKLWFAVGVVVGGGTVIAVARNL